MTVSETREQIPTILERVGFPPDRRGEPMENLSRGMQQKVALARALLTSPVLLLLDEPTTGLDPEARAAMWVEVERLAASENLTILLTTHYLEEAEEADHICIIDKGKIVSYGTPLDIKKDLVQEYVLVDADDRRRLSEELARLELPIEGDGPFKIMLAGRGVHPVLKSIDTPLSLVRTHAPTLEDAYLEIVTPKDLVDAPTPDGGA